MAKKITIPDTEKIRMMKSTGMTEKMAVMKMAHMKKAEKKENESTSVEKSPTDVKEDAYPYGLRIELDHEGLKKIGLHKMPKVGSKHKLMVHAKVTNASERADEHNKKPRREVSMQITHMGHSGSIDPENEQGNGLQDQ